MFSPQTEAWGIVLLLNEYELWEYDWEKSRLPIGEINHQNRPTKKYTAKDNSKGWHDGGMKVYYKLVKEIKERREHETSKSWECHYMKEKHGGNMAGATTTTAEPPDDISINEDFVALFRGEHKKYRVTGV